MQKKVAKTIHMTPSLAGIIYERAEKNSRSFSGEVEFILKKQFQSELNKLIEAECLEQPQS